MNSDDVILLILLDGVWLSDNTSNVTISSFMFMLDFFSRYVLYCSRWFSLCIGDGCFDMFYNITIKIMQSIQHLQI